MPAATETIDLVRQVLQIPNADTLIPDNDILGILDNLVIKEFSKASPREIWQDYIGNGEYRYALPSTWNEGLSVVKGIFISSGQVRDEVDANEYEIIKADDSLLGIATAASGATSITLSTVANAAYFKDGDIIQIRETNSGTVTSETNWVTADGNATTGAVTVKNALATTYNATPQVKKIDHIVFYSMSPESSDTFSVKHTGLHTHDEDTDTIPSADYNAFVSLLSALTAKALMAKYAKPVSSSFGADAVDYQGLVGLWGEVVKEHMKAFRDHFGIEQDHGRKAAGAFVDVDTRFQHGRRFLNHGGPYR